MREEPVRANTRLLPIVVMIAGILIWAALAALRVFPESAFPSPLAVAYGFVEEIKTGRLFNDLVASLFRVTVGFVLAAASGIPLGLVLGNHLTSRTALLP